MKLLRNRPVVTLHLDFYNEDCSRLGYAMNFCRLTNVSEEHDAFHFGTRTEKTVLSAFFNVTY